MNNDVLPTFETHDAKIDVMLSDNGHEFCGTSPTETATVSQLRYLYTTRDNVARSKMAPMITDNLLDSMKISSSISCESRLPSLPEQR